MRSGFRVAVVVPAYHEERLLPRTLEGIPAWVDLIVVVDDGSTDDTYAVASAFAERDPRVRAIQLLPNKGVGRAIIVGYREAVGLGAAIVAVMAGDDQMDPAELASVVDPIIRGDADYVKGNRLAHPDAEVMPPVRRRGSHLLARLTSLAAGLPSDAIDDAQCGYTAISSRAINTLPLDQIFSRYGYPNDMILRLTEAGLRIEEVPVRPVYADEVSGLSPVRVVRPIGKILLRGWLRRKGVIAS